ncbi:MAG: lysophospholipid acyltransferase family protein [Gammaproteobacteria bacterium]
MRVMPAAATPSLVRSWLFYLGVVLSLIVYAPLAILLWPFPHRWRYRFVTSWSHVNLWWLARSCGLRYRLEAREPLGTAPAVLLCKHQSAWETFALQRLLPPHVWVLKRELLWIPLFGWGLATLRPIAIHRGRTHRALKQIIEQGRARLREGLWVLVFPEGTRVPVGERRAYANSGALLAIRAGCAVVPIAHNAGLFWPRKSIGKRPGVIDVVIGPRIETEGRRPEEVTDEAERWIEATCARLCSSP